MLAEIFMLQIEAEARASRSSDWAVHDPQFVPMSLAPPSPFSDRTVHNPRFVPMSLAPPTAPADDTGADQSLGGSDTQDGA
jgi:hypothetical protein